MSLLSTLRRHRNGKNRLRVLVVDDSAYNRQTITSMLESDGGVEVVGRAADGREALQLAFDLEPDVITLDLEMPEMDGFSFLRLLMSRRPMPVIVISGHSQRENVFRALELGAMDFLAKPTRHIGPELREIQAELVRKIRVVSRLHAVRLQLRAQSLRLQRDARRTREVVAIPDGPIEEVLARVAATPTPDPPTEAEPVGEPPWGVVAIAASTGGPPAIQQLLGELASDLPIAILLAQHMPARFTRAFAGRLDKLSSMSVVEAEDEQTVYSGRVYVAPGAANLVVRRRKDKTVAINVKPPEAPGPGEMAKITPSGDALFRSAADIYGSRLCTVVLTGMGSDGREGAVYAARRGAVVLAENPASAVMPGMPKSVVDAGVADEVLSIEALPDAIARFAARLRAPSETK